jgi:hypothetical protein
VTQGASSASALEALQQFFGCGRISVNRRHNNHKEDLHQYIVAGRRELTERIIPFFRQHPLRTAKQGDFEKFAKCVDLMEHERHLTPAGLLEIVRIAETMNRRKPRHELSRILRGHTPEALDIGS